MPPGEERRHLSAGQVVLFLFLWLTTAFSLGTSVLMGPVRWTSSAARSAGLAQGAENALIGAIILLYVVGTFALSLAIARVVSASRRIDVRYGLPALALACAAGALWLWMTPEAMGGEGQEVDAGVHFTFGPYPTERKMEELRRRGYSAVITLLHPAVIPFEPKLLDDEREAARRVGIRLIHLPMLPWVSENREALDQLESLAREGKGRYYVHCYLGQDRVHLARRIVEEAGGATVSSEMQARSLATQGHLERGDIHVLEEGVFLVPYPTDEEFVAFFLSGGVRAVVSLMDPDDPADLRWIEKERGLLERYGLPFHLAAIRRSPYDPDSALAAAQQVRAMAPPVAVHAFLSPSTGRAPAAEAFLQAWRSGLPPLPPSAFRESLRGGDVEVIAPNIAVGPRPAPSEFVDALGGQGIRAFVRVGSPDDADAAQDAEIAARSGLRFRSSEPGDPALLADLATAGPWYLYGPAVGPVREAAARLYGPAVPAATRPGLERPPIGGESSAPPDPATAPASAQAPPLPAARAFLERWIPAPAQVVLLAPPLLLGAALAGALAGWMRAGRNVRAPFTRKVFHFLIFTMAGVLQLTAGLPAVALFGGIATLVVLYAVLRGDGFPFYEAMARPGDAPRRTFFILVPLVTTALGGVLGNLFFPSVAWIGYLVGGWGDAAGEPVGAAWGRHRYRVPSIAGVAATRSLEGSAAVLLVGILAAFLGLLAFGVPPARALAIAAACGAAGALTEAVSTHGLDNLTIQLAASGTAFVLLQ